MIVEVFPRHFDGHGTNEMEVGVNYLNPAEYGLYGLGAETPDTLVAAASAMIDAHCRRPSLAVTSYVERVRVSRDGQTVRLTHLPVVSADGVAPAVTACRVRIRRLGRACGYNDNPLQQAAAVFGMGGTWSAVDPTTVVVYANGEAELPRNFLGVPFDEAEVTYTAGYAVTPTAVQNACAQIVKNAQATPALNVKRQAVDSMTMEYFSAALLDDEVKRMLRPYLSARLG